MKEYSDHAREIIHTTLADVFKFQIIATEDQKPNIYTSNIIASIHTVPFTDADLAHIAFSALVALSTRVRGQALTDKQLRDLNKNRRHIVQYLRQERAELRRGDKYV